MPNMTESEKILAFVSFCIEEYKNNLGTKGRNVAELFEAQCNQDSSCAFPNFSDLFRQLHSSTNFGRYGFRFDELVP